MDVYFKEFRWERWPAFRLF